MSTLKQRQQAATHLANRDGNHVVVHGYPWDRDGGGMSLNAVIHISEADIQEYLYEEASCAAEDRRDAERDERISHDQT